MKKFSFRLESVLRARRIQEDQVRARLIVANRDVLLATRRVDDRQLRYDQINRPSGVLSQDEFDAAWFSLDASAAAIRHSHVERVEVERVAALIRAEWIEAKNRTEILERLRERAHDEWQVEARRDEDRVTDDLVVGRHHLRQPNQQSSLYPLTGAGAS